MEKFVSLGATLLVALALVACGSGNTDSTTDPAQAVVVATAPPPADLVFVNVPTDTRKTSVMPGENGVEIAAFRVEGLNTPIEQLVFTNKAAAPAPSTLFRKVRLVSSNGDVGFESFYKVSFDDKNGTITLDFSYQWVPADSGVVRSTYSLIADMSPDAKPDTAFSIELTAAQTHAFGKTVAIEVRGGKFRVEPVVGMDLPTIATESPASFMATIELDGSDMQMGSFKASCPAKNNAPCVLETVRFRACGMNDPRLSVDDDSWQSGYYSYSPEGYYAPTINNVGYSILPGATKMFTVFAKPYSSGLQLNLIDTVWNVGDSTKVSSSISSTPGSLLEANVKECPDSGKG